MAEDLVARVSEIIPRYSMLARGDRVGVAVSGGADSVVLLHLLHRLRCELAIHLTVLHVNHGLRGDESDRDEQFVRNLAGTLGLQFAGTQAVQGPGNLEQEARRARRNFFRTCRDQSNLQKIALGHTKSDQAETVLYRVLRGSGIAGLSGMRLVSHDGIIRPLLLTTRADVRAWATAEGISWREDSSNANEEFARNHLRNNVIPSLAARFNLNLEGTLAGMAEVASAEEDYWGTQIEPLYRKTAKRCGFGFVLDLGAVSECHEAVRRRLLRRVIEGVRGDLRSIDVKHVDAILDICRSKQGHDRIVIPGVDAIRSFGTLLLARPGALNAHSRDYCIDLNINQITELPFAAGSIELSVLSSQYENCVKVKKESQFPKEVADLNFEALTSRITASRLQVRNWRPGDEMLRPGHQKPEKIKSLFQEFQIPLWKRRHWPVAVVDGVVFWARSFGVASPYLPNSESRTTATLCYRPGDQLSEV